MEAVIDQAGEQTNPVVQNRSGGWAIRRKKLIPLRKDYLSQVARLNWL